jgi:hypothetical protein
MAQTLAQQLDTFVANNRDVRISTIVKNGQIVNPQLDEIWGGAHNAPSSFANYFDYFYSGQDVMVFIDGSEFDPRFAQLPLLGIGYNVTQQKTPVYGFWSYTYDGVARGQRIVNGTFAIATKYPDYMRDCIAVAAQSRSKVKSYRYYRDMTQDDTQLATYWNKNSDPAMNSTGENLWSIHPPFSFVMIYGTQDISISPNGIAGRDQYLNTLNNHTALFTDINERIVESDVETHANRIVIDDCELTDCQRQITPDGDVLIETYSFFARDIITGPNASTATKQVAPTQAQFVRSPNTGNGLSGADPGVRRIQ